LADESSRADDPDAERSDDLMWVGTVDWEPPANHLVRSIQVGWRADNSFMVFWTANVDPLEESEAWSLFSQAGDVSTEGEFTFDEPVYIQDVLTLSYLVSIERSISGAFLLGVKIQAGG
jgi:hypothetical protein